MHKITGREEWLTLSASPWTLSTRPLKGASVRSTQSGRDKVNSYSGLGLVDLLLSAPSRSEWPPRLSMRQDTDSTSQSEHKTASLFWDQTNKLVKILKNNFPLLFLQGFLEFRRGLFSWGHNPWTLGRRCLQFTKPEHIPDPDLFNSLFLMPQTKTP